MRSPAAHRHARALRARVRKRIKQDKHRIGLSPGDWWRTTVKLRSHHSKPYKQLEEIFFDFSPNTEGMPQRWQCKCGQNVPVTQTFCGFCGTRWDKVKKQTKVQPQAKAQPKAQAVPQIPQEFMLPNVGYSLPQSSQSGVASMETTPATQHTAKSIKTQLHQRANRIGKVETRIQKLQHGLSEISQTWPAHVQERTQSLHNDLQKCMHFQEQATKELETLQLELQGLLTQRLDQDVNTAEDRGHVHHPQVDQGLTTGVDVTPQVYAVLSQLQAQGMIQVNAPLLGHDLMDCTEAPIPGVQPPLGLNSNSVPLRVQNPVVQPALQPMHPSVGMPMPYQVPPHHAPVQPSHGCTPMPNQPMIPGMQMFANLPNHMPAADPNSSYGQRHSIHNMTQVCSIPDPMSPPPGNWEIPQHMLNMNGQNAIGSGAEAVLPQPQVGQASQSAPVLPIVQGGTQDEGTIMFPNPLYKAPEHKQPAQPVPNSAPQDQTLVEQAVHTATAELLHRHAVQDPAQLPLEIQQKLQAFAAQQEYCQQQIAQLTQSRQEPKAPVTPVLAASPQTPVPTRVDAAPATPQAMSIYSSPEQLHHMSASPPGQRTTKVPKSGPGNVHQQPTVVMQSNGEVIPVPLSPCNSQASMVPTEIAESEWQGPQANEPCG